MTRTVNFLTFFLLWAKIQGWTVPILHVRICQWLDECNEPVRVLMVFRGAAKSTIYAVYKAYRIYKDRSRRSLVWSADNDTATMLTADTINVLRNHPLCRGILPSKPGAKRFWVHGARDRRNATMRASGVNSNVTGARADDVDFDDIEVPGNIETPEARMKMRQRISESTHIAVPGAQKTFIGTPHTHDSIYPERISEGAAVLKIPLFEHTVRYTDTKRRTRYPVPFKASDDGLYVMLGIYKGARMLVEGIDYRYDGEHVEFTTPPGAVLDICAGNAWPERFDRTEIEIRRKETRTLNAWDSQYSLEAKPLTEVRLDPTRIIAYDVQPRLVQANNATALFLGNIQIVGAAARWDPSGGKLNSDASAFGAVYQDGDGRRYLHHVEAVNGEVAEFAPDGKTIIGGQVFEICAAVKRMHLPRVSVETNGIGGFAPAVLRAALKQQRIICAVVEVSNGTNKNKRILETLEPLLMSRGMLWAHADVLRGPFYNEMRDWNPGITNQPDDHLDAAAGAISDTPERIKAKVGIPSVSEPQDWRQSAGQTIEAVFEH